MKKDKIKQLDSWSDDIIYEVSQSYFLPYDCRGGTVIDCGSNIGAFPIFFNIRFDKYICYEADPDNCRYAEEKLKNINYPNNFDLSRICVIENKACYKDSKGTVPIYRHTGGLSGDNSIYTGKHHLKKNKITNVPTVSLEDIRKKYFCDKCQSPIKLLKCDIEGAEYDFLLGKDLSIFQFICMEIHGEESSFHKMINFINKTHEILDVRDRVVIAGLKK
jgi:FkbM family methyltransferase